MACAAVFTVNDGSTVVTVRAGSVNEAFEISRELLDDGLDKIRYADGGGDLYVRYQAYRYIISGQGPGEPGLWALDITASPWTVTIPGFADGSANEAWSVLPALPVQTRNKRTGSQSWSVTFESAADES